jgi:hypothetical protein
MRAQHPAEAARDEESGLGLATVREPRRLERRPGWLRKSLEAHARRSARIIVAAFSAIIKVGELVLPEVMRGMTEASAMRRA